MADSFPPQGPAFPDLNSSSESENQPAAPEEPRLSPNTRLNRFFSRCFSDEEEDERREQIFDRHVTPILHDFLRHLQQNADDIADGSLPVREFLRDHLSTASNRRNGGGRRDDPVDADELLRRIGGRPAEQLWIFIEKYRDCVLEFYANRLDCEDNFPPIDEFRALIAEALPEDSYMESDREDELVEDLTFQIDGIDLDSGNDPLAGSGGGGSNGHNGCGGSSSNGHTVGGDLDGQVASTAAPEKWA